jgi:hypothetical protein
LCQVVVSWAFSPQTTTRRVNGYAAARGITGSLLIALNFFFISTCSYFLPMPGVLWPVIASEILSGTSRSSSRDCELNGLAQLLAQVETDFATAGPQHRSRIRERAAGSRAREESRSIHHETGKKGGNAG